MRVQCSSGWQNKKAPAKGCACLLHPQCWDGLSVRQHKRSWTTGCKITAVTGWLSLTPASPDELYVKCIRYLLNRSGCSGMLLRPPAQPCQSPLMERNWTWDFPSKDLAQIKLVGFLQLTPGRREVSASGPWTSCAEASPGEKAQNQSSQAPSAAFAEPEMLLQHPSPLWELLQRWCQ